MAAGAVEVVEHRQQLGDNRGLGALGDELLVAQRALAVVVVLRLDALQGGLQFGELFERRRICPLRGSGRGGFRRRPTGGRPGRLLTDFASLGIDTPFVGDGHRLVRIVLAHLFSRSSSTTSASTTSSCDGPAEPASDPPPAACSAWVDS